MLQNRKKEKRPDTGKSKEQHFLAKPEELAHNRIKKGMRTYLDLVVPSGIDPTNPDCIGIDGAYMGFLVLLNYPTHVPGAWLDDIINAGEGVELSLYAFPQNKTEIIRDITNYMGYTRHYMTKGDTQQDTEVQENALTHSKYMKKGLADGEDFWFMHGIIRVVAETREILANRMGDVESILAGKDIFYQRTDFRHVEAFLSTMPWCDLKETFVDQSAKNVLTSGLSSTFPFISYELSDPEGVFMGLNAHNNSALMLNIFDTSKYSNANMTLFGSSGYGKTTLLQMLARRMRLQNIPIMMICPFKGFEYREMCDSLGGKFIRIAPGSKSRINMLEIRPQSHAVKTDSGQEESWLAKKLQNLQIYFSLMFPGITQSEQHRLERILLSVYQIKGITMENASLYVTQEASEQLLFKPVLKEMPILGDLLAAIQEEPGLKDIAEKLESYVTGSLSFFNGQTNVDLSNGYIVADISDIRKDIIPLAMFTAMDIFWDKIKEDITKRKVLILDEVWKVMGAGANTLTAEYVLELYKTIRGFGGSAIAATQDVTDYMALEDGKFGRGIINNAQIKIILHLEEFEILMLKDVLRLSKEEISQLQNFGRGEGLLYAGGTHVTVKFERSELEKKLTSTDRRERLEYMKEKEKEAG